MTSPSSAKDTLVQTPSPVTHYENFPVASWLCPPHLRPAITAIYGFARTADDIADEGDAPESARLADLAELRHDLKAIACKEAHSNRWPGVFNPLAQVMQDFSLPSAPLLDLLNAFEQDVRFTAVGSRYLNDTELLDYCSRSANPVGRLLLHLYGVSDEVSLAQSDQICTALQLINFWQDVSVDAAKGRWYVTAQALKRHDVQEQDLQADRPSKNASNLIADYAHTARSMMLKGAPLAGRLPGRAGWELRLVVQGGLRILDKIEALNFETWRKRPKLSALDFPVLLWRAWRMV